MMIQFIFNNLLFNPILIYSRLFYTLYIPCVNILDLSLIDHNTRAHSHVLSLIYSSIISLGSPVSIYMLLFNYYPLNAIAINIYKFLYNFSISYFCIDLILGIQYYPKILKTNILTFGVHHIVYICILTYGKINNILPIFMVLIPFEIPTIFLSIGYIDNNYKNPSIFGILFFIFRILYNILIVWKMYTIHFGLCIFTLLTLCVHIYWFRSYVKKYILN